MHKRVAYHRVSDDSVSSTMIPESAIPQVVEEFKSSPDIDYVWTRDVNGIVDFEWHRILGTRERIELSDFPYIGWVTRNN